jgi:outer membrane protein assembly factor BamD (BamD/ComL family)
MFSISTFAQDTDEDKEKVSIDVLLEADAKRNLNIAWQYFKLKKAYRASLVRMEETMAAHPTFSKIDEVLYISGMSSYYLAVDKGKQKIDLEKIPEEDRDKYTPEKLRESAIGYLGELIESHPDSKYAKKAKKTFNKLKPKESN